MLAGRTVTFTLTVVLFVVLCGPSNATAQRGRRPGRSEPPLTEDQKQAAAKALDDLVQKAKAQKSIAADDLQRAVSVVSTAARVMPPEELAAKLAALQEYRSDSAIPMPKRPLGEDKELDRRIITLQLSALKRAPPETVRAHPCAEDFPGPVPDDAKRVSREVKITADAPGWHNGGIYGNPGSNYWHSTGLYAVAGEVVTVTVPQSATEKGLQVRIGCHRDLLWRKRSWARAPDICTVRPIVAAETKTASGFGGLIYIETPHQLTVPPFTATINGAVEAPYYVHGKTDLGQWRDSIRLNPAPWAELQSDKLILTLPSKDVRKLDDPKQLMAFWDRIMDCYAELLGRSPRRRRIERFVPDIQISAGYMHSGYPLMTMLDITGTMVDRQRIERNGHHGVWGLFHEIGHNHQNRDWTFRGTTEVTVNLFSLYVMEKTCGLKIAGHPSITEPVRNRKIAQHFAAGTPFDRWQSDPFLALAMYIQLQQEFGWEPFSKVFAEYREVPDAERPRTDDQKRDQWMVRFSKTVGRNLGPFFQAWGVPTSEKARASIAELDEWMPKGLPSEKPNED